MVPLWYQSLNSRTNLVYHRAGSVFGIPGCGALASAVAPEPNVRAHPPRSAARGRGALRKKPLGSLKTYSPNVDRTPLCVNRYINTVTTAPPLLQVTFIPYVCHWIIMTYR